MAITYLTLLNRTLRKLREPQVTDVTGNSDYVDLVAQLVNEAHEEVEEAWEWSYQNTTADISIVSGTNLYALTGWGEQHTIDTIYDDSKNFTLQGPITNAEMDQMYNYAVDTSTSAYFWTPYGQDSNGDPQLKFYPSPGESTTVKVLGRVKQGWLSASGDMVKCPWRPVMLLAYSYAVSERGEDGGIGVEESRMDYATALSRAIASDLNLGHKDADWKVA